MHYEESERDFVMLQHKYVAGWTDGSEVRLTFFDLFFVPSYVDVLKWIRHVDAGAIRESFRQTLGDGTYGGSALWPRVIAS
jgi:hypothetical protein